ncbi:PepSY domain-containing protein [Aeromicrobium wangtongii]|uniref:PepSY domain-containing protein n=1 Tax=Aeromicrobium wangtongii TaxID=2969247 RepID=UPI0020172284|nr:PepSY domain-containing protein [Aeromicrobium wangtongii]MCL3817024.1 PepSY domain-containing protein [Aeromicrobium wangtongii]
MRTSLTAIAASLVLILTASACGNDDDKISSADREKAEAAALKYVGAGKATETDRGDGDDDYAYEVEVELPDGLDIEVQLDENFKVTNRPPTASDLAAPAPTTTPSAKPSASPSTVAPDDDRGLLGKTAIRAKDAALKATGGGEVLSTEGSDDADHVYEVEVRTPSGEDVTVELDADFEVVRIDR